MPSGVYKRKPFTREHKRNISRARKGIRHSLERIRKMSNAKKGKHRSPETKKKISETMKGAKSYLWRGGISFEPYGVKFNKELKEQIRKRDNYRCQECFRHQDELFKNTKAGWRPYELFIHHINYNKKNNKPENLISLCLNCHAQTNFKREDWTKYFQSKTLLGEEE